MIRLAVLAACVALIAQPTLAADSPRKDDKKLMEHARKLHKKMITIDTHADIETSFATPERNPGTSLSNQKVDLVKMEEGGLDAVFFAVYVGQAELSKDSYAAAYATALAKFAAIHRMCLILNPDRVSLALAPGDLAKIRKKGRRIALIGVENGFPIGEDIGNLRFFYDLGARYLTITHNGYNQLADSCNPNGKIPAVKYGGLSEFGREVVREMNRLGMMIDISHAAPETVADILALTRAPIVATHSGCRALCDVTRNLTDDQLIAIKKNGGTVQIVAYAGFLKTPEKDASLRDFVDHIDHAVKVMGIDHVGIGTDFDGGGGIPGFNDPSDCVNVTVELLKRGYSDRDIQKIWGGNLIRVWRKVIEVSEGK